jgi:hypothetical protein
MEYITKLKGGSLNSTSLHIDGERIFVRKLISTKANREYGYVRWYSQLKKLQRYNELFPGLVPKVLDAGVTAEGAYFDIEYIDNKDIKTLFKKGLIKDVEALNVALWSAFSTLHSNTYTPTTNSLMLYYKEEVEQKLNDARQFPEFERYFRTIDVDYNKFKALFNQPITSECYVHGNPTLENILYDPLTNKVTFIDLYEEGIVDSKFADYSQVLQCSNSYYGLINDSNARMEGDKIIFNHVIPKELETFNNLFVSEIQVRYPNDYKLVKLFEATQFFRMLPFKCHVGDINKAKIFYKHATELVNEILCGK